MIAMTTMVFCLFVIFPKESASVFVRSFSLFKIRPAVKPASNMPLLDPLVLDGKRALEETSKFLAVGPRCSGTDGAERAANYLANRLKEIGIDPIIDEFKDITPEGEKTFRNVMGELQGSKEAIIILVSHYDTKSGISPEFAGANDSGSSTGLLLELARVMKNSKPGGSTILFAFLDGEECIKEYGSHDGLHGSKHLVKTLVRNMRVHKIIAVFVIDMVGDKNLNIGIPRNSSPPLTSIVFNSATEENVRLNFSLADGNILDDHVPFLQAGMRAIDIIDFDYGSEPGKNDYWHTAQDTFDKLSAESLQIVGRVVLRALNTLRDIDPTTEFKTP
ncbi:MAG: M28 family metallopeptidase [Kiritimatiellae bacterium]|nr:M28 family metallopeptidase [Kiritimatiellia bacterium]